MITETDIKITEKLGEFADKELKTDMGQHICSNEWNLLGKIENSKGDEIVGQYINDFGDIKFV